MHRLHRLYVEWSWKLWRRWYWKLIRPRMKQTKFVNDCWACSFARRHNATCAQHWRLN